MSELSPDGPMKSVFCHLVAVALAHFSLLVQRLMRFPCETRAGEACGVKSWLETGVSGVKTWQYVYLGTCMPSAEGANEMTRGLYSRGF